MPECEPSGPALVHHWLLRQRGGERVLAEMASALPGAPVFTLVAREQVARAVVGERPVHTSFLQRVPGAVRWHRWFLPVYPLAARRLDCRRHDPVIISDAAVVKGVRCDPAATVICYCHSPPRYLWEQRGEYAAQGSRLAAVGLGVFSGAVRKFDRRAARRLTGLVANSHHVRRRIGRCYGRRAVVIYPPADVPGEPPACEPDDFYLVLGELVEYKRADLALEACRRLGRRLIVAGEGPLRRRLARHGGRGVEFVGRVDEARREELMRRCRALLFCGEEDFGLVPVEVMGRGRPVIALRRGGAMETVIEGVTGLFFDEPRVEAVVEAMRRLEDGAVRGTADQMHAHASRFGAGAFREAFGRLLAWCEEHRGLAPDARRAVFEGLAVDAFDPRAGETGRIVGRGGEVGVDWRCQ